MKNNCEKSIEEIVAEKFKKMLNDRGKSQRDYAIEHNLDPSTVSKWINNKRPMTISEIKEAADYFEVSVNDFFYDGLEKKRLEVAQSEYHPKMAQQSVQVLVYKNEFKKPFSSIVVVILSFMLFFLSSILLSRINYYWSLFILGGFVYYWKYLKKFFGVKKNFIINYLDEIYYYRNNTKNKWFWPTLIMHIASTVIIVILFILYSLSYAETKNDLSLINMIILLIALSMFISSSSLINRKYNSIVYHDDMNGYKFTLANLCINIVVLCLSFLYLISNIRENFYFLLISLIPLIFTIFEFKYTCNNYAEYKLVYQKNGGELEELFKKNC